MRSIRRAVTALVIAATVVVGTGVPAVAKGPDPCKLLKRSEVERELDGDASKATRGLNTAVSKTCEFELPATADRPDGVVVVYVQTVGAKIAYETNRMLEGNAPVPGIPKSYAGDASTGEYSVNTVKGDVFMFVQGVFYALEPPEMDPAVLEEAIVALTKKARARL